MLSTTSSAVMPLSYEREYAFNSYQKLEINIYTVSNKDIHFGVNCPFNKFFQMIKLD